METTRFYALARSVAAVALGFDRGRIEFGLTSGTEAKPAEQAAGGAGERRIVRGHGMVNG